jgi:protein-tyrosine phosphatase
MAEGVFRKLVDDVGLSGYFEIDSAGTSSWHVGEKAHSGTRRELARHGIQYQGCARQLRQRDLTDRQTYLIAMDNSNINDIKSYFGVHDRLYRLLDFASHNSVKDVPDPYYNGRFGYVYELVEDGCIGLLAKIREDEEI